MNDKCGIVGIHNKQGENVLVDIYNGLLALQHRGQESAGIAYVDANDGEVYRIAGMGTVAQAIDYDEISNIDSSIAIGHVRYSTSADSSIEYAQPLLTKDTDYNIQNPFFAIAHNGSLVNTKELEEYLEDNLIDFDNRLDTNIIANTLKLYDKSWSDRVYYTNQRIDGAYAYVLLCNEGIWASVDTYGFRPLWYTAAYGEDELEETVSYWFASETCAFDAMGVKGYDVNTLPSPVAPGLSISSNSEYRDLGTKQYGCAFEQVYFSRPDSLAVSSSMEYETMWKRRYDMGAELTNVFKPPAPNKSIVIGVPDSGTPQAMGYANAANLTYTEGLVRNRYIGRTFIHPNQSMRDNAAEQKYSVIDHNIFNKHVIVVDDSLVRGTTMKRIVQQLRDVGAYEVHVLIASPEVKHPCYFGIDIDDRSELLAANMSRSEMQNYLDADSLEFLTVEGLHKVIGMREFPICDACFTGNYRLTVTDALEQSVL